jgi:hypothetical protein
VYLLKVLPSSVSRNRIGGVMVSVLASRVVDRGFEPRSVQTKDYKIGIYCEEERRRFRVNQSLLFLLNVAYLADKQ